MITVAVVYCNQRLYVWETHPSNQFVINRKWWREKWSSFRFHFSFTERSGVNSVTWIDTFTEHLKTSEIQPMGPSIWLLLKFYLFLSTLILITHTETDTKVYFWGVGFILKLILLYQCNVFVFLYSILFRKSLSERSEKEKEKEKVELRWFWH